MKNRAKCKLCSDIIESFHRSDYVSCRCEEIAIDGGQESFRCIYKNKDNFLRIDDEGNTIIPTFKESKTTEEIKIINVVESKEDKKKRLIESLDQMIESIERLPPTAMLTPITNYDHASLLLWLSAMFKLESAE